MNFTITSIKPKHLFAFIISLLINANAISQFAEPEKKLRDARKDTINGWQAGAVVMLNFGQTSLTNWASGGENSISGNSFFNLFANYRKKHAHLG
ncbi:MAG: DUF3078 domain-containing protein [Bacteroidales bacterium]|nr:DUF3078 domain-containing protein [Bacteroidales bacterium]